MKRTFALSALSTLCTLSLVSSVYAAQGMRQRAAIAPGQASNISQAPNLRDREDDGEQPDDQEEQQDDARLQDLTQITAQQAEEAARTVASGTLSRISLDNEDGTVVYKVVLGQTEVLVDAGNGTVLETERVGDESSPDPAIQGSIQVPDDDAGEQGIDN